MVDKIQKYLLRLSGYERNKVDVIINQILKGDIKQVKTGKLTGYPDIYRIKLDHTRIIYRIREGKVFLLFVGKRDEKTYRQF